MKKTVFFVVSLSRKIKINMKRIVALSLFAAFLSLSCQRESSYKEKLYVNYEKLDPQSLDIKSYSKALFSIDTADFINGLKSIKNDFLVFLGGDLNNEEAVRYLKDFATDTFCIRVNEMVERKYEDTEALNKEIKSIYQHVNYYYPEINLPPTYFYVSGIDYNVPSVMIDEQGIVIALDYYLANEDGLYDYVGMPRFRSLRCHPSYITRDIAESIYLGYIEKPTPQRDILTEMVKVGKKIYFVEAMNPFIPDSVLLGYSAKQMDWARQHEGDIWASVVGNNMLYAKNAEVFRTYFGDAPFTQAYSNEAPARLGEFLGLQIIRSYMTNNDVSLQDMIKNGDVQQIFQTSQYKPKS